MVAVPADFRPFIDRGHLRRRDERWVHERLADPLALVALVGDSRILVSGDHPPHPLLLPLGDLTDCHLELEPIVLLGLWQGATLLAAGLSDEQSQHRMAARGGAWADLRALGWLFESWEGDVACLAKAMVHWHRVHRFCGQCGGATRSTRGGFVRVCTDPSCGVEQFPRTDPAVIVLVTHGDDALLARQPSWTQGRYSAVAGFVEPAEGLEQAAFREVWEETGVRIREVRYRFSQAWPFPGTLMTAFCATTDDRVIARDEGELEDARWFSRAELRQGLHDGMLSLPPPFAAGFRLIGEWFDADGSNLRGVVAPVPAA